MKLHLGCGNIIMKGWINQDVVDLEGVDSVCDLQKFPWPYEEDTFSHIKAHHLLEHLSDTIRTMEEIYRISKHKGIVNIRVPFWNSPDMISDPTHKVFFNEKTFDYFDPSKFYCQQRPYYSKARFEILRIKIFIKFRDVYKEVQSDLIKKLLLWISQFLGGIIWVIEYELRVLK
jgi:SAM-dependent methyltransferase